MLEWFELFELGKERKTDEYICDIIVGYKTLYSNVIWISRKWMRIHTREVEISQNGQNGKKSKCWLLTWKSQSLTLTKINGNIQKSH